MKYWRDLLFLILGVGVTLLLLLFFKGHMDYNVNIINFLSFISTCTLAVFVCFLTKSFNKKDEIRQMVINELKELYHLFETTPQIFLQFERGDIDIEKTHEMVNLVFHKSDLIIDRINKELKISFPKLYNKYNEDFLCQITNKYYRWLTGDTLFKKDFTVTEQFKKENETNMYNTVSDIILIIHKLLKES